ncbi:hypothetical protein FNF27_00127 [Cafeteria roenbergensis]|uniref:Uncharacterized protein n=2 Tax=Cafeteria roenbergensis TaxID=33653 RepID=A0A5A8CIP9_CAFRO|nr:hypothetical protein FNF29_03420 [Cafeteria roenbergensis]KAA0178274.1 hypothetical protein FNF27_00127 [Cafeteria roenbergensis]|eukprot:KAA0152896.1 hypothetical protein FNF29_03420 [Cafeteria roenbergensis]
METGEPGHGDAVAACVGLAVAVLSMESPPDGAVELSSETLNVVIGSALVGPGEGAAGGADAAAVGAALQSASDIVCRAARRLSGRPEAAATLCELAYRLLLDSRVVPGGELAQALEACVDLHPPGSGPAGDAVLSAACKACAAACGAHFAVPVLLLRADAEGADLAAIDERCAEHVRVSVARCESLLPQAAALDTVLAAAAKRAGSGAALDATAAALTLLAACGVGHGNPDSGLRGLGVRTVKAELGSACELLVSSTAPPALLEGVVGSGKAAINGCVFLRPESGEPLDSRGLELLRGLCESYARAADSAASSLMDEAEV